MAGMLSKVEERLRRIDIVKSSIIYAAMIRIMIKRMANLKN